MYAAVMKHSFWHFSFREGAVWMQKEKLHKRDDDATDEKSLWNVKHTRARAPSILAQGQSRRRTEISILRRALFCAQHDSFSNKPHTAHKGFIFCWSPLWWILFIRWSAQLRLKSSIFKGYRDGERKHSGHEFFRVEKNILISAP